MLPFFSKELTRGEAGSRQVLNYKNEENNSLVTIHSSSYIHVNLYQVVSLHLQECNAVSWIETEQGTDIQKVKGNSLQETQRNFVENKEIDKFSAYTEALQELNQSYLQSKSH